MRSPALLVVVASATVVAAAAPAVAKTLKGQSFADEVKVGDETLVLNGLGVREATVFKVDVYVAGLYVKTASKDGAALLAADAPWRLELKFVRDVEKEKLSEAWDEGFQKTAKGKHGAAQKKLNGFMDDVAKGDVMAFTYLPGAGVEVKVKGKKKGVVGVVGDAAFARAFLAIWLGSDPPNASLKSGLLGR